MKPCGRLLELIVLAGFAVVTGFTLPPALAQTVDPQSLVGQWAGTWAMANEPGVQGTHNMTISKVDGNQVFGHVDRIGVNFRSEERRVGKECRSRWSPYH